MNVLIAGPHGGQNLGDEFILSRIASEVQEQGHQVTGTSIDPDYTRAVHGFDSVPMLDIRHLRFQVLRALREVDALIIGGGEQIQEGRIGYPIWGLLPNVAHLVRTAKKLEKPTMLWGVGVDHIETRYGKWMLKHWVRQADAVTVRDGRSFQRLADLGFREEQLHLAADPVFSVDRLSRVNGRSYLEALLGSRIFGKRLILVAAANDRGTDLGYLESLISGCRHAAESLDATVLVLSMHTQKRYDLLLLEHPSFREDHLLIQMPLFKFSASDLALLFAGVDVVVASRMHALIIAATQGTPWLNISRGAKMDALGEMFDESPLGVKNLSSEAVRACIEELIRIGPSQWQSRQDPHLRDLQSAADVSGRIFAELSRTVPAPTEARTTPSNISTADVRNA
jgi:polysaccharide pyruvyl transferase WcaK-like protein